MNIVQNLCQYMKNFHSKSFFLVSTNKSTCAVKNGGNLNILNVKTTDKKLIASLVLPKRALRNLCFNIKTSYLNKIKHLPTFGQGCKLTKFHSIICI